MAMVSRIATEASTKDGLTIDELLEFAQEVESALTRGQISRDDLLLASVNFSAGVRRMSVLSKDKDKGAFNVA